MLSIKAELGAVNLLIIGYGYTAKSLHNKLPDNTNVLAATKRYWPESPSAFSGYVLNDEISTLPNEIIAAATHILISVPPNDQGCRVLPRITNHISANCQWVGFLSSTAVYGDVKGAWVDEQSACQPTRRAGKIRLLAEQQWLATSHPVHIFRVAGIYGPDRNALVRLRAGDCQRIVKPGHVFSRIHVDDLASILLASMLQPQPRTIYNCADDLPASPAEIIEFCCEQLQWPLPPAVSVADSSVSPSLRDFYQDSRRVANHKIKNELGVQLHYPTYETAYKEWL